MKFNRVIFFNHVRALHLQQRGVGFVQSQVNGLNFLLDQIEGDPIWKRIEHIAYSLATTAWETAWTFQAIDERGGVAYFERRYGFHTKIGMRLGNDAPGEGALYHGRGDVQLTGEDNYERAEEKLRTLYPELINDFERRNHQHFDLTEFPDQAKHPAIAYQIMALGMYQGWFTGKKLSDFINAKKVDYIRARAIINGKDKAEEIAVLANAFEDALRAALNPLDSSVAAAAGTSYTTNEEPARAGAAATIPRDENNVGAETPTQLQREPDANAAEPSMFDRIGNTINQTRDIVATVQERAGQVKETVTTVTDIVGLPGTRPTDAGQIVTKGRIARRIMAGGSLVLSFLSTFYGVVLSNWKLIALGLAAVVVIAAVFIAATVALDALRLKYFSDPKRYNVE